MATMRMIQVSVSFTVSAIHTLHTLTLNSIPCNSLSLRPDPIGIHVLSPSSRSKAVMIWLILHQLLPYSYPVALTDLFVGLLSLNAYYWLSWCKDALPKAMRETLSLLKIYRGRLSSLVTKQLA